MKKLVIAVLILTALGTVAGCSSTPDGHSDSHGDHQSGHGCH